LKKRDGHSRFKRSLFQGRRGRRGNQNRDVKEKGSHAGAASPESRSPGKRKGWKKNFITLKGYTRTSGGNKSRKKKSGELNIRGEGGGTRGGRYSIKEDNEEESMPGKSRLERGNQKEKRSDKKVKREIG